MKLVSGVSATRSGREEGFSQRWQPWFARSLGSVSYNQVLQDANTVLKLTHMMENAHIMFDFSSNKFCGDAKIAGAQSRGCRWWKPDSSRGDASKVVFR